MVRDGRVELGIDIEIIIGMIGRGAGDGMLVGGQSDSVSTGCIPYTNDSTAALALALVDRFM